MSAVVDPPRAGSRRGLREQKVGMGVGWFCVSSWMDARTRTALDSLGSSPALVFPLLLLEWGAGREGESWSERRAGRESESW